MTEQENYYKWTEEMSVGAEELDKQHQRLFEILNDVYRAYINNDLVAIGRILDVLSQYMIYHFTMEEVYFDMCNYCDKEEHTREHRVFREKIEHFVAKYKSSDAKLTHEILDFLKSWIEEHLLTSDQKYKEAFASHGIK